jgi:hypothetical protein
VWQNASFEMAKKQIQFEERLRQLARKHRAESRGYVTRVQPDGLIIAQPKRQSVQIPFRVLLFILAAFFGFKAFLFASIGPLPYEDRLARLQSGTVAEEAGAFVMQADPLTVYIANQIGPRLRKLL